MRLLVLTKPFMARVGFWQAVARVLGNEEGKAQSCRGVASTNRFDVTDRRNLRFGRLTPGAGQQMETGDGNGADT